MIAIYTPMHHGPQNSYLHTYAPWPTHDGHLYKYTHTHTHTHQPSAIPDRRGPEQENCSPHLVSTRVALKILIATLYQQTLTHQWRLCVCMAEASQSLSLAESHWGGETDPAAQC